MGLLEKIFGKPKEKCLICGRAITDEWNSSGLECFECGLTGRLHKTCIDPHAQPWQSVGGTMKCPKCKAG